MLAQCDSQVQPSRDGWHWVGRFWTILVLLAIGQADGVAGEPGGDFAHWRSPERDGVNCLYLQLRLLGYTGTYEEVVAAMPGGAAWPSLGTIAQAAKRLGFGLVPVELTMAELASRNSPTIMLFEEAELGHGRFHLLLGFSSTKAVLVKGEFVTRFEMPIDQFRRGWTGFALVPPLRSPWPGRFLGVMLGAMTAGTAVWCVRRSARRRKHLASTSTEWMPFFS